MKCLNVLQPESLSELVFKFLIKKLGDGVVLSFARTLGCLTLYENLEDCVYEILSQSRYRSGNIQRVCFLVASFCLF